MVCNRGAILADGIGDVFLSEMELVGKSPVRQRFVYRIQVFALNVFDEGDLQSISLFH